MPPVVMLAMEAFWLLHFVSDVSVSCTPPEVVTVAPAPVSVFSFMSSHLNEFPICCSSKILLVPQCEELGEDQAEVCISYLLHPFSLRFRFRKRKPAKHFGNEMHAGVAIATAKLPAHVDPVGRPGFHPR